MKNIIVKIQINTATPQIKTVVLSKKDFDKLVRFSKLSGLKRFKISHSKETFESASNYKEFEKDLLTTVLRGV